MQSANSYKDKLQFKPFFYCNLNYNSLLPRKTAYKRLFLFIQHTTSIIY